jgi:hypothetical protein
MLSFKPQSTAALLTVLAAGLFAGQAHSSTNDIKAISAALCQPFGPGTTIGELTYSQHGVTNPGTTNEMVICPITTDGDVHWSSSAGTSAYLEVYFRAGSVSGKAACTAYTGSIDINQGPFFSAAANPTPAAAGVRGVYLMNIAESSAGYGVAPPTVLICTLTPKASLGAIFLHETVSTNIP